MEFAEKISLLQEYKVELDAILSRFTRTHERISIDSQDNVRLRVLTTEIIDLLHDHVPDSVQHIQMIANSYNQGFGKFYNSSSYASVQEIRGLVVAVITRVERSQKISGAVTLGTNDRNLLGALETLICRFHAVAVQLRSRHGRRNTLNISDEYDVQDLMHALLRLYFDDVRPEEWVPSYAGSASRTDFLLPQIDTVVEIKKTRRGLNAKEVGEQLIIDISKYKRHPKCHRLICFVYDPEGLVANPAGIESDLNAGDHGLEVKVYILPKMTS